MNTESFKERLEDGKINIKKLDDDRYEVSESRWDTFTGKKSDDAITIVSLQTLENQRDNLAETFSKAKKQLEEEHTRVINGIEEIIKEFKKVK